MKKFAFALTTVSLLASAASAATVGRNERPGPDAMVQAAEQTVEVRASEVLTATELRRADLEPDAKITVTSFPTTPTTNYPANADR